MSSKLVCGVGNNDVRCISKTNKKLYDNWVDMLKRCYLETRWPSYRGCSVATEWHTLSNFKKWYEENYVDGWQLDKDLLYPRNKIYSKETCLFIPHKINSLLTFTNKNRGEHPLGVSFNGKYVSVCSTGKGNNGVRVKKIFEDSMDAHLHYLQI